MTACPRSNVTARDRHPLRESRGCAYVNVTVNVSRAGDGWRDGWQDGWHQGSARPARHYLPSDLPTTTPALTYLPNLPHLLYFTYCQQHLPDPTYLTYC
jgi:hypothetical protein